MSPSTPVLAREKTYTINYTQKKKRLQSMGRYNKQVVEDVTPTYNKWRTKESYSNSDRTSAH